MENPCKTCLVRSVCSTSCEKLKYFVDYFISTFHQETPVGEVIKLWEKEEVRPNKNNGRVA